MNTIVNVDFDNICYDMITGVSVDFDDVFYGLTTINLKYIKETYGVELKPHEVSSWTYYKDNGFQSILENVWNNPEKYLEGDLIYGALEFYRELQHMFGKNNVQIVTASFPNIIKDKSKYIQSIFDNDCKIINTHDKSLYTGNTILIDDNVDNILKHVEDNKVPGIIFGLDYGWNSNFKEDNNYIFRARSYDETFSRIKDIMERQDLVLRNDF